jgi:hypothetical protein
MLEAYEDTDDKRYLYALSLGTILIFVGILVATGFLFAYYGAGGCQLNQFFTSFNLILGVAIVLASIHPNVQEANPQSGFPPAAIVTRGSFVVHRCLLMHAVYATYLLFSAMSGEPETTCNPLMSSTQPRTMNIVLGTVLTFVALIYSTSNIATRPGGLSGSDRYQSMAMSDMNGADASSQDFDDEQEECSYSYSFFHVMYAVASMYVAMMINNWNTIQISDGIAVIGQSWQSVWVKIVSSWIVFILYFWTLVAPLVFPDREW